MAFSQVQRVFVVGHCLESRYYLTYYNEFKDTFPDYLVPNKSTCRLVDRLRGAIFFHRFASNMRKRVKAIIAERRGHYQ